MQQVRTFLLVTTTAIAVAAPASAQIPVAPPTTVRPSPPSGWTVEGQETEGVVTDVDRAAGTIRLDNGETYRVPPALGARLAMIEPGSAVRLRYGVQRGENIAIAVSPLP
ncbi:MAG TPA: DUF1344 domain-containing protein [Methylomirabilota bacterium]|jgi:hypothetical protein|nr:DUF1344 domain-containing protein [Methylomirabilota bacterium]